MNTTGQTSNPSGIKISRMFLWTLLLAITFTETISVQRRIDCRKFVHAPICRGIAAKRDTQAHMDDISFGQITENGNADYYLDSVPKNPSTEKISLPILNELLTILRKSSLKNVEYDTGTGSYNGNLI